MPVPILAETQLQPEPGVIDLGIGQPQDALLPIELLSRAMSTPAGGHHRLGLQYGPERGDRRTRSLLARFLTAHYGVAADPGQLLISNGNSQALDLCCGALTRPGDIVFVEEPTYFLALQIFADHGLQVVGIPVDDDGLRIDALETALEQHSPSLVYVIPTGQNPTGSTMPDERRRRLVELAEHHGFLVVADEVYQLLQYTGAVPQPLAAHVDSGAVLSLGTFSKILAPGLRLGWVQAAEGLVARLAARGQLGSGGGLNPFTSSIVASVLEGEEFEQYLQGLRQTLHRRLDVLDDAVRTELGDLVRYRRPDAGYFFWLQLPESVDTTALRPVARAVGVGFQPGPAFSTEQLHRNCLRLAFSYYADADLRAGVARLAHCL